MLEYLTVEKIVFSDAARGSKYTKFSLIIQNVQKRMETA